MTAGAHSRDGAEPWRRQRRGGARGATSTSGSRTRPLTSAIASSAVRSPDIDAADRHAGRDRLRRGRGRAGGRAGRASAATTPRRRARRQRRDRARTAVRDPLVLIRARSLALEDARIVRDHPVHAQGHRAGPAQAGSSTVQTRTGAPSAWQRSTTASTTTAKCSIAAVAPAPASSAAIRSGSARAHCARVPGATTGASARRCPRPAAVLRVGQAEPQRRLGGAERPQRLGPERADEACARRGRGAAAPPPPPASAPPPSGRGARRPRCAREEGKRLVQRGQLGRRAGRRVVREHERSLHVVDVELDQVAAELDRQPRATRACSRARAPPRRGGRYAAAGRRAGGGRSLALDHDDRAVVAELAAANARQSASSVFGQLLRRERARWPSAAASSRSSP